MEILPRPTTIPGTASSEAGRNLIAGWAAVLVAGSILVTSCAKEIPTPSRTFNSELAYLEQVNQTATEIDPQIIFLLMGQYLNSNQQQRGMAFYARYMKDHDARLPPPYKALYLSAWALLRATHAQRVPLLDRVGWVRETIAKLEQAKKFSGGRIFLVRWISGVVYARLPGFFDKERAALEELNWCIENISLAPHPGWAREVYFHLALVHHNEGRPDQATKNLQMSGYTSYDKAITLTTPYAVNAREGMRFYPERFQEIVPGRVFALSGFDFTEFYFVVSRDGKELIAIDAGTKPQSARSAYEVLKKRIPGIPPLTTVFVTHAHWDHIGGYRAFQAINPEVRFVARANYLDELKRIRDAPAVPTYFFGSEFSLEHTAKFTPDVMVRKQREMQVGGTRFQLIPITGGETPDGMFIYLPESRVLFAGDFVMPYLGAPFIEEGSLPGLLKAIDLVAHLQPQVLLHGHEPLTRIFSSAAMLTALKPGLEWLERQVGRSIRAGKSRAQIHHQNLIAPAILRDKRLQAAYLVMRENLINRIYDQRIGYWQPNLGGMDYLTPRELGTILSDYLDIAVDSQAEAAEKMAASGDLHLAARTILWALARHPESARLRVAEQYVFLKLKEKYQELNPFKFIIYSERIKSETPGMGSTQ